MTIKPPSIKTIWGLHWFWVVLCITIALIRQERHDYTYYVLQWQGMMRGDSPWASLPGGGDNAYGPVHNLFAPFTVIHTMVPKMIIVMVFMLAATLLLRRVLATRGTSGLALAVYTLAIPANMLITLMGVGYGLNDLLVAAFLAFALLTHMDQRKLWTAFWLALAVLLKFYPAIFVPFFVLSQRRIDWRLGLATAGFVLGGFAFSFLLWGPDILTPLLFAGGRNASFLSFWVTLRDTPATAAFAEFGMRYNAIIIVVVGLVLGLFAYLRGTHWLAALILCTFGILMFYKVGHQQFFMPWCVAVAALPLQQSKECDRFALTALPYLLALSIFDFFFVVYEKFVYDYVWVWPIVFIPISVVTLIMLMTAVLRSPAKT